ncbi:MAG: folate-binding protein YgfZ [Planctomycetales bacterium]|nr:folate-binding protein YgfZ [Planctomycetales bacterium]
MIQSKNSSTPQADYAAARSAAALFDLSDRTHLELTGTDRAKFLHGFCTNEIKAVKPGQGTEAFITNVQGRVLGHVFVFATDSSLWLDTVVGQSERLVKHLSRYQITEDVSFGDRSEEWAELLVAGPQAADIVSKIAAVSLPTNHLAHVVAPGVLSNGVALQVRRFDILGVPGFLLLTLRESIPELIALVAARGARSVGPDVFESLRIEAVWPHYGRDMSDENLAQEENRTTQAISFKKGCYLGQEPIARIDALGHVNQELRLIRIPASLPPPAGSELFSIDSDAKAIGRVTSSACDFENEGGAVALAYLRRGFLEGGMSVRVRVDDQFVNASIMR